LNGRQYIERAGDSKEESPISSLVGSGCEATLNTAFEEPKHTPFPVLQNRTITVIASKTSRSVLKKISPSL